MSSRKSSSRKSSSRKSSSRKSSFAFHLIASCLGLLVLLLPATARAQDKATDKPDDKPAERRAAQPWDQSIPDCHYQHTRVQDSDCRQARSRNYTVYLQNVSQQNDANEILVALRNLLDPAVKIFLVSSQNAIVIQTYPEEYARAEALIKALDRPRKSFRLTFTLTDFDGDKRIGTQHLSMVVLNGQRTTLKQGSKIPVATGTTGSGGDAQTSFQYLDIGLNIDVTLTDIAGGGILKAKVEESSSAPVGATILGVTEPIIRQSVLDGVTQLALGKPSIIGSVDLPGTTHRLDVAVSLEALP